ncbi:Hypothetical predicted protein, partial [Podarcis lilfordi]
VTAATLITKADKFTFGQETTCVTPHAGPALLDMKGTYFSISLCQALLLHPQLQLQVTEVLNPVTPPPMGENGPPTPDCIYSSRPDLKDEANPRQYEIGLLQLIYTNPFDSPSLGALQTPPHASPHRIGSAPTRRLPCWCHPWKLASLRTAQEKSSVD